jgi:hypothetical protein
VVTRFRYPLLLLVPALAGAAADPGLGCGCDPGAGTVFDEDGDGAGTTLDCDDNDPQVFPGADEHCDGVDEDCDGEVDEESVDALTWYEDLDGDGWGGEGTTEACELPSGYAEASGDCDDDDPTIHPGAVEQCCDEVDQDCDGALDNACSGDLVVLGETSHAEVGWVLAPAGDPDGDGFEDLLIGAPEATPVLDGAQGKVYLFSGRADLEPGQEILLQEEALLFQGLREGLGASLAGLGDLNGDGYDDVAMGAPEASAGGYSTGAVVIAYGPVSAGASDGWNQGVIRGEQSGAMLGWSVAGVGDVTGDGALDIAIGSPYFDRVDVDDGIISVFSGHVEGEQSATQASLVVAGDVHTEQVGSTVAGAGDHDGDGLDDLLFRHRQGSWGGVGVLNGPRQGTVSAYDIDAFISECDHNGDFGTALTWAGDTDADGYDDFLVGASMEQEGMAYLVRGPLLTSGTCELAAATLVGTVADGRFAYALEAGFDADADGHPDLAIGAPQAQIEPCSLHVGAAYLWHGPVEGTLNDSSADRTFLGVDVNVHLGAGLAAMDLDGDGLDDLAVGAPGTDVFNREEGAVWITLGSGL